MSSVVKGLENLDALKESAQEVLPDITVELLPIDLPFGWRFRDIKHAHLLAFYEESPHEKNYKSRFHMSQAYVEAAINANFFEAPVNVSPDVLAGMNWQEVEQLRTAVINHVTNLVNTPKN